MKNAMLLNTFKKGLAIFVIAIFSFQLLGLVPDTHAAWRDQSDQLPGINEGPSPVVYVAVAAVTIGIVYLIAKAFKNKSVDAEGGGDDQIEENKPETSTPDSSRLRNLSYGHVEISSSDESGVPGKNQSVIEPFIGLNADTEAGLGQNNSKDKMVVMGLTVNF